MSLNLEEIGKLGAFEACYMQVAVELHSYSGIINGILFKMVDEEQLLLYKTPTNAYLEACIKTISAYHYLRDPETFFAGQPLKI